MNEANVTSGNDGVNTENRINTEGSPSEIESQIDAKRARIDRTLGQLENKLSPREMMNEGLDMFKNHGGDITESLSRSFKDNPAPFVVAGVGLAWLIASTSSGSSSSRGRRFDSDGYDFDDRDDVYSNRPRQHARSGFESNEYNFEDDYESDSDDESLKDRAGDALDSMSDKASEIGSTLQSRYDRLQRKSSRQSEQLRQQARGHMRAARGQGQQLTQLLSERPLLTGVCGLAVGAVIGSLMPPTEMEDRNVGELSDEMKQRAGEQAADGAEQVRHQVESAAETAREKAEGKIDSAQSAGSSTKTSDSTSPVPA